MKRKKTKKNTKKKNKKISHKTTFFVRIIVFSLVFLGAFSYALYRLFVSRNIHLPLPPVFETYPSRGIEIKTKDLDRCIYDALLILNIPARDVVFKRVEKLNDRKDLWVFSELEIHIPNTLLTSKIKKEFIAQLSERIPKKSICFATDSKQDLILDLSINGHHTHRIIFVKLREKMPTPYLPSGLPKVAIIIDDMGYDPKIASRFLVLNGVMSFSVLPYSPFQKSIATKIYRSGKDVLLHLPMEPMEFPNVNPGIGALLSSMTPDDLLDQLRKNLDEVPFVVGVNNHMGSRLTQEPAKIRQIFTFLKKRNLFFIDSLTSPRSCCERCAHLLKLKFAQRHIFLDHVQDPKAIRFQIKRLVGVARKVGYAIGIGHPYPTTLEVLREELPNIRNQVNFVRVSELVG